MASSAVTLHSPSLSGVIPANLHCSDRQSVCELEGSCASLGYLAWHCRLLLGKLLISTLLCTLWLKRRSTANKTRLVLSGKQSSLTNAWSRVQTQELYKSDFGGEKLSRRPFLSSQVGYTEHHSFISVEQWVWPNTRPEYTRSGQEQYHLYTSKNLL